MVGTTNTSKSIDHLQRSEESQSNSNCAEFNLNCKMAKIEINNKTELGIHLISSPSPCGPETVDESPHGLQRWPNIPVGSSAVSFLPLDLVCSFTFIGVALTRQFDWSQWTVKWTFFATPKQFNKGHYPVLHEPILLPPAASTYLPSLPLIQLWIIQTTWGVYIKVPDEWK